MSMTHAIQCQSMPVKVSPCMCTNISPLANKCFVSMCQLPNHDSETYYWLISKDKWLSLMHHVCNEHEWTTGGCDHEEMEPGEEHPPWFDQRDQDFEVLQKVVLEPSLLDSFTYYVKFR